MMTKQTQTDSALALGFGKDWFQKLQAKAKYNIYQAEYYDRMAEDYHDELFHRKAEKTLNCSKVWHLDYYKSTESRTSGRSFVVTIIFVMSVKA